MSETAVLHQVIMSKKSVDETTSTVLGPGQLSRVRELTLYVKFSPSTTSGVVTLEAAHDAAFTGTWSSIATATWAVTNSVLHTSTTGAHMAVRARISTVIAGGTVDVIAIGN